MERTPIGFTDEQFSWLREQSKITGVPVSVLVRRIVQKEMDEYDSPPERRDITPSEFSIQELDLLRALKAMLHSPTL